MAYHFEGEQKNSEHPMNFTPLTFRFMFIFRLLLTDTSVLQTFRLWSVSYYNNFEYMDGYDVRHTIFRDYQTIYFSDGFRDESDFHLAVVCILMFGSMLICGLWIVCGVCMLLVYLEGIVCLSCNI